MKKLLALLAALLIFSGCSTTAADHTVYNIAVVPQVWSDELNEEIANHVSDRPQLNVYQTMLDEADGLYQTLLVQDLTAQGIDAICLQVIDSEAMAPMIEQAEAAGVVVVVGEDVSAMIDQAAQLLGA